MIKINLHQRKAAVGVTASTTEIPEGGMKGFQSLLQKIRGGGGLEGIEFGADLKSLAVLAGFYAVILGVGIWYVGDRKQKQLAEVVAQIGDIDKKISVLDSELSKTQGYEVTKRNLEADEKKIRTKIDTIQELIRDRTTPPKILMTLSDAIPKEVWLSNFSLRDRQFAISGLATSMDLVSDFIKSLSETIYFKDVQLKGSRSSVDKDKREVTNFELEAQRR